MSSNAKQQIDYNAIFKQVSASEQSILSVIHKCMELAVSQAKTIVLKEAAYNIEAEADKYFVESLKDDVDLNIKLGLK